MSTHPAIRQGKRLPLQLRNRFLELLDLNELVLVHIAKSLAGVGGRPPDFETFDARCLSQSDVLLKRRCPERAAAADHTLNEAAPAPLVFDRHFDTGAQSRPIAFHPYQLHADPVITITGVLEKHGSVLVGWNRAACLDEQVLIAIVIDVGKS